MDACGWLLASTIWCGWRFLLILQANRIYMTQKEAIIKALNRLGGKAKLNDIYRLAPTLADFSGSKNWKATIRSCLQREPDAFRSSKRGWWELVSNQEDIACRDRRIKELEEENARLRAVPTEDDFVGRFVKKVKHHLKRDKKTVEEIRKLMDSLGRSDADRELDEWLQVKDRRKSSAGNITVQGDYILNKNVENEVEHVESRQKTEAKPSGSR